MTERSVNRSRRLILDHQAGAPRTVTGGTASGLILKRNRSRPRSRALVDAIASIDVTTDPALRQQVIDFIRDCYVERDGGPLVGLMAHCYLGGDFVDHRLDMSLRIAQHYTESTPPPAPFHVARPLARTEAYAYIELYSDGSIIPIRPDGTPAV